MSAPGYALGIDLGGTRLKVVAVDRGGAVLHRIVRPTVDHGPAALPPWADAARTVSQQMAEALGCAPTVIGVAAPGLASKSRRCIDYMPGRLAGLEGFDWTSFFNSPRLVPVLNDAHAHLLGEAWVGAARGHRDVILLTLGTGVGGAILSDGHLLRGHIGRGGHLGHISLDPDGPPDNTRMPGSLEDAIGECTLAKRTGGRFASTVELVNAAASGDAAAALAWARSIRALGCGIAGLVNVVDPELVLLGGGNAQLGDQLLVPLQKVLDEMEWRPGGAAVALKTTALGEWAGGIGAAQSAWKQLAEEMPA